MVISIKDIDDDSVPLKLLKTNQVSHIEEEECRLVLHKQKSSSRSLISDSTAGNSREQNITKFNMNTSASHEEEAMVDINTCNFSSLTDSKLNDTFSQAVQDKRDYQGDRFIPNRRPSDSYQ